MSPFYTIVGEYEIKLFYPPEHVQNRFDEIFDIVKVSFETLENKYADSCAPKNEVADRPGPFGRIGGFLSR
jgi:hypothetical protein